MKGNIGQKNSLYAWKYLRLLITVCFFLPSFCCLVLKYILFLLSFCNSAKLPLCWNNSFYDIWFTRSVIIMIPDTPTEFTIFVAKADDPAAFSFFIFYWLSNQVLFYQARYTANCLSETNYSYPIPSYSYSYSCFLIFIVDCQHTIISYALLTNNILINLNHPLCSL